MESPDAASNEAVDCGMPAVTSSADRVPPSDTSVAADVPPLDAPTSVSNDQSQVGDSSPTAKPAPQSPAAVPPSTSFGAVKRGLSMSIASGFDVVINIKQSLLSLDPKHYVNLPSWIRLPLICDLVHGNLRSMAVMFLTFVLVIFGSFTFVILALTHPGSPDMSLTFFGGLPQSAMFGQKLPRISLQLLDGSDAPIRGATIALTVLAVQPFALNTRVLYQELPNFMVNCLADTYWQQRPYLCNNTRIPGAMTVQSAVTNEDGVAHVDGFALNFGVPGMYQLTATCWNSAKARTESVNTLIQFDILLYKLTVNKALSGTIHLGAQQHVELTTTVSVTDSSHPPALLAALIPMRVPVVTTPVAGFISDSEFYPDDEAVVEFDTQFAPLSSCVPDNQGNATAVTCKLIFDSKVTGSHGTAGALAVLFMGRAVAAAVQVNDKDDVYPKRLIYPLPFASAAATVEALGGDDEGQFPNATVEATPFLLRLRVLDASGAPLSGLRVSLRALNIDPVVTASPYVPKYLVYNVSDITDLNGTATLTTQFSSTGAIGTYHIHCRVASALAITPPILVTSRVLEFESIKTRSLATLREVGSLLAGVSNELVTKDNAALIVSEVTDGAHSSHSGPHSQQPLEAIPGKFAVLRFAKPPGVGADVFNGVVAQADDNVLVSDVSGTVVISSLTIPAVPSWANATARGDARLETEVVVDDIVVGSFAVDVLYPRSAGSKRALQCAVVTAAITDVTKVPFSQGAVFLTVRMYSTLGTQLNAANAASFLVATTVGVNSFMPVTVRRLPLNASAPLDLPVALAMALPISTRRSFEHVTVHIWDSRCNGRRGVAPVSVRGVVTVPVRPIAVDLVTVSATSSSSAAPNHFDVVHHMASNAFGPTGIEYFIAQMPLTASQYHDPVEELTPSCSVVNSSTSPTSASITVTCELHMDAFANAPGAYYIVPRYQMLDFPAAAFTVSVAAFVPASINIDPYYITVPSLYYGVRACTFDASGQPVADVALALTMQLVSDADGTVLFDCDVWKKSSDMKRCALVMVEMDVDPSAPVNDDSRVTGSPTPPASTTGADGCVNFQLMELSGLPETPAGASWYLASTLGKVTGRVLLDNDDCACYNTSVDVDLVASAMVVEGFPISVFPQSEIAFSVNTQMPLWGSGIIAMPSCWDANSGASVVCLWRDDPRYTFPSHFFVSASQVLDIALLQFPVETSPGHPYTIKVQLPGLPELLPVGTVTVTQAGCVGTIETPPPTNVTVLSRFDMNVSFMCGAVPVRNRQAFVTLASTDPSCAGTACGVINAPHNTGYTDNDGRVTFSIVVTDAAPGFYALVVSVNNVEQNLQSAFVGPSVALGTDITSVRRAPVSAIQRFFSAALTTLGSGSQITVAVQSLVFYIDNPVLSVVIEEQPESIEGQRYTGTPLHFHATPRVRVRVAEGGSLRQVIEFDLVNADDVLSTAAASVVLPNGRSHVVTDGNGTAEFANLVFQHGPPGAFRMVFYCRGVASAPSAVFHVEGPEHTSIEEIKEKCETFSLIFLALSVPLLWANVPGSPWFVIAFADAICIAYLGAARSIFDLARQFKPQTLLVVHTSLSMVIVGLLAMCFTAMLVVRTVEHFGRYPWLRFLDDEERMVRYYRYTYWMLRWRAKRQMTHQELLNRDIRAQARTLRKRLFLRPAHAIEHCCGDRPVGENIAEKLVGEWHMHDASQPYWPPMGKVPPELEIRLPPRVIMVCSVGVALCTVMSYVGYYALSSLDDWMRVIQADLATVRDAVDSDVRSNDLIVEALTGAINMLIQLLPDQNLNVLRQLEPYIKQVNFVAIVDTVAAIVTSIQPNIYAFGVAAVGCGVLSVAVTLHMTVQKARSFSRKMRRGALERGTDVELEAADEYVGLHCVHIAFTYAVAVGGFMVAACLALFAKSIATFFWSLILALGIMFIIENVISTFMSYFLHLGMYMTQPKIYSLWTVPAAVLSVFSGVMVLGLRVGKFFLTLCAFFARFDKRMLPTTMITKDTAHERFVAMVAVDTLYNNPIILTYAGYFAAVTELKYYTLRVNSDQPPPPLCPVIFGDWCAFPHMRNMVRMQISVLLGLVDPRLPPDDARASSRLKKLGRSFLAALFPRPCEDIATRADEMPHPINVADVMKFDNDSVRRRRIARRWALCVLLTRNPSLIRHRKHNLLEVRPDRIILAHHDHHQHRHQHDDDRHSRTTDGHDEEERELEELEKADLERPLMALE